jgi:hypothetical protein
VAGRPAEDRRRLAGFLQAREGEGADGFRHPVAAVLVVELEDAPVGQVGDRRRDLLPAGGITRRDFACRRQGERPRKDGKPLHRDPFGGRDQRVGPGDRRPQRLLAGGCRAGCPDQDPEAVLELRKQVRQRHRPCARRGELEGERNAVQPAADLLRRCPVRLQLEPRDSLPHPFGKEGDRFVFVEGAKPEDELTRNAERLLAGRQHAEAGAGEEQVLHEPRRGHKDVLAVVDEQQSALSAEGLRHRAHRVAAGVDHEVEGTRRRVGDTGRLRDRGQVAEPGATRKRICRAGSQLNGKTSLTRPAAAGDRQKAGAGKEVTRLGQLPRPADKARELPGKAVRRRTGDHTRRLPATPSNPGRCKADGKTNLI